MLLELDPADAEWLSQALLALDEDLQRQIHRSDSSEYRLRLEREAVILEGIRSRLTGQLGAEMERERMLDERSEESFPASDPP